VNGRLVLCVPVRAQYPHCKWVSGLQTIGVTPRIIAANDANGVIVSLDLGPGADPESILLGHSARLPLTSACGVRRARAICAIVQGDLNRQTWS
jgi:hypothetical protein